jgi:hypothetical protein
MQNPTKSGHTDWNRFTKTLLTTTCLGVAASGGAQATTILIVEGTTPAPADFPNSSPSYLLPVGTNLVQGQLHSASSDNDDFFEFQSLMPGQSFSILGTYNPLGQERQVSYQVFNSSGTSLGIATLEGEGGLVSGTIPNNGNLIVDVSFSSQGSPTYQVALTTEVAPTPEPAVGPVAGLALAAALAWKRKRDADAKCESQE